MYEQKFENIVVFYRFLSSNRLANRHLTPNFGRAGLVKKKIIRSSFTRIVLSSRLAVTFSSGRLTLENQRRFSHIEQRIVCTSLEVGRRVNECLMKCLAPRRTEEGTRARSRGGLGVRKLKGATMC